MYERYIKRLLDIIVSLLLLIPLLIIFFIVAILIKLDDGGTILYVSKRYREKLRPFNMYKFRTMKMNAEDIRNEDGTTYNSEDDPRLTRVGKVLRKTSIDELPQIINVLKGDMSLIGPRPSPLGNEKSYNDFVLKKFKVKPGITGLNQAILRNKATLEERYKNDVYYVDNLSFLLDLKILYLTLVSVLRRKNIYR